ncbi:AsnC family transcriptional regulator [Streptomyces sp. NPDC045251]|uniref:Lrp/AsnC family transcriptional regulator n=1 Tax=unclassified Streptomyces TaxID=2593676 RepID=UPI0033CA792D
MKESVSVTELDLALVHALQIRPRAAWTEIAPSLGVTAVTLARRWERLAEQGLAWLSAVPGPAFSHSRCTAFVLVGCRPAARESLAARIAELNEAATVELTAPGSADLLLDVLAADPADVHRFVDEHLARLPEVTSVECLFATSLYTEGSRWRLGSLDPAQLSALGRRHGGAPDTEAPTSAPGEVDRALLDALAHDGRLGLATPAQRLDVSAATVRRRLGRLTRSGTVAFRCDVAPELTGLPVAVTFRGRAPIRDVNTLHRTLATLHGCRLVAAVTGSSTVLATYWLPGIGSVQQHETAMSARLGTLEITDRIIGARTVKRMGHLLDRAGRRVGTRPVRSW